MTMQLAVYRISKGVYGAPEDAQGRSDFYFLAPKGLEARNADTQRVSPYYADQMRCFKALVEKNEDYAS